MKCSHKLLFFLNSFSLGLLAPVLTMVLCGHGATLTTASLFTGVFSLTVVISEVPSGIAADLAGRRKIFILSHIFIWISFFLILLSRHAALLAVGCVFLGLGRSFSSGSLEALEIEQALEEHGPACLERVNRLLSVIESLALASGALLSGYLGHLDSSYSLILLCLLAMETLLLLLSILFVREQPGHPTPAETGRKKETSLSENLSSLFALMRCSAFLKLILAMSVVLGLFLSAVEIYWQPDLLKLLPGQLTWIPGAVSCLGYLGVTLGSTAGARLMARLRSAASGKWSLYAFLRLMLPIPMFLFALCNAWYVFALCYIILYILLGAANLAENTLLHSIVPNRHRASMLSLLSLFTRGGGLITSVLGSILLKNSTVSTVWICISILAFLLTLGGFLLFFAFHHHTAENSGPSSGSRRPL